MAKLTIVRLAQSKNDYGSYSYKIIEGTPDEATKLYGEEKNIIYSNQKVGIWNKSTEVEHFLGKSKSGKSYSAFSVDKELNSFAQRGHTATLAVKSGLDAEKINMLKMISELDEQELRVQVIQRKLIGLPSNQHKAVNPSVKPQVSDIEDAEIVEQKEEVVKDEVVN